jgi:hypothetical protein
MTNSEYKRRLHELIYTCETNQRYHQRLEWRFGWADKSLKIVVGLLAFFGAVLAAPGLPSSWAWAGFIVAGFSAAFAVALNVIPVGATEKTHGELFRLWSDLLTDALQEEHKTCDKVDNGEAAKAQDERLSELIGKKESLNASESAAWQGLLLECMEDVNERRWGGGVRTAQQVEAERARREEQNRGPTVSAC